MKYIITVEEETFEIEMGRGELVWINHHPYTVDLQDVDGRPEYSLLVDHRSYEAHVEEVEGGECQMMVAGRPYRAHLQHGSAALPCILEGDAALPCVLEGGHCLRKPTVRPEPCGVEEVCAPLPGLLV
ncbi:MAG: hypothetical protein U9R15_18805, partial [Chloroflexota bacterium]|nr:hypothetical protein [Chloroflexota bacterium]